MSVFCCILCPVLDLTLDEGYVLSCSRAPTPNAHVLLSSRAHVLLRPNAHVHMSSRAHVLPCSRAPLLPSHLLVPVQVVVVWALAGGLVDGRRVEVGLSRAPAVAQPAAGEGNHPGSVHGVGRTDGSSHPLSKPPRRLPVAQVAHSATLQLTQQTQRNTIVNIRYAFILNY